MNEVVAVINQVGFPIAVCIAAAWYINHTNDLHREDIKNLTEQYSREMTEITTALNNNTVALTKLADKLDGGKTDASDI